MNWFYQKWWKWLSAAILVYALIGNFFVPLGPGVTDVQPTFFHPDSICTFQVTAYNSHFQSPTAGRVQMWFKNKNQYFTPLTLRIINNETVEARFALSSVQQAGITPAEFDVVLNDDVDGTFALREAITLIKSAKVDSSFQTLATVSTPEVKNNKHHLFCFPYREILYETIRNTFFHVPMWFVMTALLFGSLIWSILYLTNGKDKYDIMAHQAVIVGILFGMCGYLTGLVWAKYTWYVGVSWGDVLRKLLLEDIKMAAALVAIFFYLAYLILKSAINDKAKRAKVGAMYNVFAFVVFILCVFVIPRLNDSMHPGNGGNPAFSKYDLDSTLRMFFYPVIIGWILLGFWIFSILIRLQFIQQKRAS